MQGEIHKIDCVENEQEEHRKSDHPQLTKLNTELAQQASPEAKLRCALDSMERALNQGSTPLFKVFWEARRLCLELFKEELSHSNRIHYWNKYTELSKEAYRLKAIFEEQSNFAAEQIEIAIKAIEDEIASMNEKIEAPLEFPVHSKILESHTVYYKKTQSELNFLNAHASRINSLRKELIKTEMRIRNKNRLFQRLSKLGDHVFPRRKELIKSLSDHFLEDVTRFIDVYFKKDNEKRSLFFLREEIKALQGMAKFLTLNTPSFSETRLGLSKCWDEVKELDKERKKERLEQRDLYKENAIQIENKIKEFHASFPSFTIEQANASLDEVHTLIRNQKLTREDIQSLRSSLSEARKEVLQREQIAEQNRDKQESEKKEQRKSVFMGLKSRVDNLLNESHAKDNKLISSERDLLLSEIKEAQIAKQEKQSLERSLKSLEDVIADKEQESILAFSENDKTAYDQLIQIYDERLEKRQTIKNQLDTYRKLSASSGLDFQQAIAYQEQIALESQRLDKITQNIEEIEEKIEALKNNS